MRTHQKLCSRLSAIVADHRRCRRRKQKSLFLAIIADLKNLWEMSKSCFFLNKQINNQLKFDRNHELYVKRGQFVPWRKISKHIGCHLRRSPMYENFQRLVHSRLATIGDKRRRSSVTVCDEWELGFIRLYLSCWQFTVPPIISSMQCDNIK
jgi:hypothetical protein